MRRYSVRFLLVLFLANLTVSGIHAYASDPIINTVAGGGPDAIPAKHANLLWPSNAAVDAQGRIYFTAWQRVYRLTASGDLEAVAGVGGDRGYSGDGLPALNADLYYPSGLAFDAAGNLFIADTLNGRVRKVDMATGVITTIAGGGAADPGDGGLATAAKLWEPVGLAFDGTGNLYISDWETSRIRRVDAGSGMISTYAQITRPSYLAIDATGNLYVSEQMGNSVQRVDAATHLISTAASGFAGPTGLALDSAAGQLYIAAQDKIFRLTLGTSTLAPLAGGNFPGYSGDDGAGPVLFHFDSGETFGGIGLDGAGHLLIGDSWNNRLRRLTLSNGSVTTVAGNGADFQSEDGFPATRTYFNFPFSTALDAAGNLYVAEDHVRVVDAATGLVGTAMGIPIGGGAAQPLPSGSLLADSAGNLYIATDTQILRRDALTGMLSLVAGNGTMGFSGDGGPATAAQLGSPWLGSLDGPGNLYFVDVESQRIRRIDALTGIINTVAGNGSITYSGDGGPAVSAGLNPSDVGSDAAGNLYIADHRNNRVRKVDAGTGIISTYAGTGVRGNGPDDVLATQSDLNRPQSIALDSNGNVHVADGSVRLRRIDALTQIITTVAGSGIGGFYGDGGPAASARFEDFSDISFDASDSLTIADAFSFRIRKVSADNLAPIAAAGADFQAECGSASGSSVHLDGSSSSDDDSTPGTNDDIVQFEWFENFGAANQELLGSGETLDVALPVGSHLITLRVTDRGGLSDTDEVQVDVTTDTMAPRITVRVSPDVLYPGNHRFVAIHATVTATDACGAASVVLVKITGTDGGISWDPVPPSDLRGAALGTADFDLELRAECFGFGSGRTYTLTYQATDAAGNASLGSAVVFVPHDRKPTSETPVKTRRPPRPR